MFSIEIIVFPEGDVGCESSSANSSASGWALVDLNRFDTILDEICDLYDISTHLPGPTYHGLEFAESANFYVKLDCPWIWQWRLLHDRLAATASREGPVSGTPPS